MYKESIENGKQKNVAVIYIGTMWFRLDFLNRNKSKAYAINFLCETKNSINIVSYF